MARITTIINQKGGVGKTSTAHALATGLNHRNYKALVVDADPQGNLSYIMQTEAAKGVYEAMKGTPAADLIQHTGQGDVLASTPALIGADLEFTQTGREYLIKDALEPVKSKYSHIIIDSPPTLGIMTINALTASTDIIIPMGADIFSLQGLGAALRNHRKSKAVLQPKLKDCRVIDYQIRPSSCIDTRFNRSNRRQSATNKRTNLQNTNKRGDSS